MSSGAGRRRAGAEQLLVALVAAVDRVGQVEVDDRQLHEPGVALVLGVAEGHGVGGAEVDGLDGALSADRVGERSVGRLDVGDVGAARPRGALPELARLRVGALLGRRDALRVGRPGRDARRDGHVRADVVAP